MSENENQKTGTRPTIEENVSEQSKAIKSKENNPTTKDYQKKIDQLNNLILSQQKKLEITEEKLKHTLADYKNLERKVNSDIVSGVNKEIDKIMIQFLQIYDDFKRAKTFLSEEKDNIEGLSSILKNMNSLLSFYDVSEIEAIGEIFNPNFHEAVSVIKDDTLDEGTITKEIRKGYISHNRVIRTSIVEISKKSKLGKPTSE